MDEKLCGFDNRMYEEEVQPPLLDLLATVVGGLGDERVSSLALRLVSDGLTAEEIQELIDRIESKYESSIRGSEVLPRRGKTVSESVVEEVTNELRVRRDSLLE